jgi:hypothetical protein
MSYRELLKFLMSLEDSQLDDNVTIYDYNEDEYIPVTDFTTTVGTDVLDDNHAILLINEGK